MMPPKIGRHFKCPAWHASELTTIPVHSNGLPLASLEFNGSGKPKGRKKSKSPRKAKEGHPTAWPSRDTWHVLQCGNLAIMFQ